jgi:tRNA A37 N6-isopentenylltransferase MiaA
MSERTKRTRGRQTAADIRTAFHRALKTLSDDGRPLHDIIRQQMLTKPLECLATISRFVPKEMMLEATISEEIDAMSDQDLDHEISALSKALQVKAARQGEKDMEEESTEAHRLN